MITAPSKGGLQKVLTLPLTKLNGWLFGVGASRVKPEVRDKLVEYQAECFEVLNDYWQKGQAVNPRTATPDERAGLRAADHQARHDAQRCLLAGTSSLQRRAH